MWSRFVFENPIQIKNYVFFRDSRNSWRRVKFNAVADYVRLISRQQNSMMAKNAEKFRGELILARRERERKEKELIKHQPHVAVLHCEQEDFVTYELMLLDAFV